MPPPPLSTQERVTNFLRAWETLRPTKVFSGFTLQQAKNKLNRSLDTRETVANLEKQLASALTARTLADTENLAFIKMIVNAVKGDPDEGEDGDLYEAMGYVRHSARRSGLRRGKNAPVPLSVAA